MSVYTSSKFAVEGIGEGLAKEVAPLGIHVTLAEPAGYGTRFIANAVSSPMVLGDYDPARRLMQEFSEHAVRGNLEASMAAIAAIAGTANPPRRLAVGAYGLEMVRGKIAELNETYDAWEHVTQNT